MGWQDNLRPRPKRKSPGWPRSKVEGDISRLENQGTFPRCPFSNFSLFALLDEREALGRRRSVT